MWLTRPNIFTTCPLEKFVNSWSRELVLKMWCPDQHLSFTWGKDAKFLGPSSIYRPKLWDEFRDLCLTNPHPGWFSCILKFQNYWPRNTNCRWVLAPKLKLSKSIGKRHRCKQTPIWSLIQCHSRKLVTQWCLTLLWPLELQPTRLHYPWSSLGNITGVCSHLLL